MADGCPELIKFVEGGVRRVEFGVALKPGNSYRVTVIALQFCSTHQHIDKYCWIGSGQAQFKAELTIGDLWQLRLRAEQHCQAHTACHVLYRNKPPEYFYDIRTKHKGVMEVYAKDNSGDQASPINGELRGLFFMAGEPSWGSPFGSSRFIVPLFVMLQRAPILYFSDFYCMRGQYHYVTIVMTKPGSIADKFCRQRLLPLGIDDNPFLFRAWNGEIRVAQGVKVELLYTENISVNEFLRCGAVIIPNIPTVGKGRSTVGGLQKNPECSICNIRPFNP